MALVVRRVLFDGSHAPADVPPEGPDRARRPFRVDPNRGCAFFDRPDIRVHFRAKGIPELSQPDAAESSGGAGQKSERGKDK